MEANGLFHCRGGKKKEEECRRGGEEEEEGGEREDLAEEGQIMLLRELTLHLLPPGRLSPHI